MEGRVSEGAWRNRYAPMLVLSAVAEPRSPPSWKGTQPQAVATVEFTRLVHNAHVQQLRSVSMYVLGAASAWAAYNIVEVFAFSEGARIHRVETACLILAGAVVLRSIAGGVAADSVPSQPQRFWQLLAAAGAVVWLCGAGLQLSFPFLSDDYVFLATDLAEPATWEFYRPVFVNVMGLMTSRSAVLSPLPFHVASMTLHLTCAILAGTLFRRLVSRDGTAWLVGALVLLNPLQLESVLWVSGLQELLWSVFALGALTVYSSSIVVDAKRALVTMALVGAALGSKETAVALALLLPATDVALGRSMRKQAPFYAAVLVCLGVYATVRANAVPAVEPRDVAITSGYQLKEFLVAPYRRLLLPLSADVLEVPGLVRAVVGVTWVAIVTAVVWSGMGLRALGIGTAAILITTLPLQRYLFVSASLEHARYLYWPAVGWACMCVGALAPLAHYPVLHRIVGVVMVGVATGMLWANLRPWSEAGEFVRVLTSEIARGGQVESVVRRWRTEQGWPSTASDALPGSHKGVWLFLNGGDQFVALTRAGRLH